MPDPDDQPPPQPPPAAPQPDSQAVIAAALQQLLQPSPQPQVDQTPVERTWLSRLGGSLAGGLDPSIPMSPAQKQAAGMRALGDFGTSLMAASHYVPGQTIFSNLAQGFQGAQKGLLGSETTAAELLGAQQSYQQKQQEMQVERLKTALPLLQSMRMAGLPNPLAGNQPGALTTTASPGSLPVINRDPSIPMAGAQANNPGNLMGAGAPGAIGTIPLTGGRTLAAFPDMPTGIAANASNLIAYQDLHGINTVQDAVKRWVSDPKADLTSYTNDIAKALGVKPTDQINFHDPAVLSKFITAQQPHETGGKGGITLNPDDVTKGVQMALGGYKPPTGPPAASAPPTPPPASTAPPAPPTAPRGAATLPTPPLPPEGMLPSPIGAPAAAPASTAGQPAGGAVVAGPPGAATVGAARPAGPAVPGDVNAILRGMITRGANPATLLPGLPGAAAPGGASTLAAGPAVTGGASASAVAQAQATNTPVEVPGGKGLWALPNGQLTSTRPAAGMPATAPQLPPPPAPTTTPAGPPTPQASTQQPTDTRADTDLTPAEYIQRHFKAATPAEAQTYTVPVDPAAMSRAQQGMAEAAKAKAAASQAYGLALTPEDKVKAADAFTKANADWQTANSAVSTLQQQAAIETAKAGAKFEEDQRQRLATTYNQLQAQKATAAQNDLTRQQEIAIEHIKAGTAETAAQRTADIDIAKNDINDRTADSQKAAHIIPVLQQVGAQLDNLPGGVVGTLLGKYDTTGDLTGMLARMGVVDPSKATSAQLLIAARNFLSIETKPAATGSLRVPEMDKLQAYTPGMLNTPQAQHEMVARLIAYQQRIEDERDFAGNYFGREDPKTGQRIYDNRGLNKAMNAPAQYDQNGNVTGGGLGPVVPEPPPLNAPDAEHQAYLNYVRRNIKPGMPYQTWAPQTDASGNTVRDANGKVVPQRVTKIQEYD